MKERQILSSDNRRLSLVETSTPEAELRIEPVQTTKFPVELVETMKSAEDYIRASVAPNTRRAYGSDLEHFTGWC